MSPGPALTLEQLLTSPAGFGLTTASPLQRAICRIADGLPIDDLLAHPLVADLDAYPEDLRERCTWDWCIGDVAALPVGVMPIELGIFAGIRGGKSVLCAGLALRASQIVDVSRLAPGETPRVPVLSLTQDLARVTHGHLVGQLQARPALRTLIAEEPKADTVMLRSPSGRPVEVKVTAGARAGASVVARWLAGAIFDEAPRMLGEADGAVVNFDDARRAALGRLLPGAQLVAVGSPWAPFGPCYEMVQQHWRKPSADIVVIRAPGPAMNPVYWTAERCHDLRRRKPDAYRVDVLAEFIDAETSLFSQTALEAATRSGSPDLPPAKGHKYIAAIDPATRGDTWTLVVVTRVLCDRHGSKLAVALCRSWRGSADAPLSPNAVLREIAGILQPYRLDYVHSDQWSADALADLARQHGTHILSEAVTAQAKVDMFEGLAVHVADQRIELAPVPELLEDLRRVRRVATQSGVRIELPRVGGRHADFAAALALACSRHVEAPDAATKRPAFGTAEYWRLEEEEHEWREDFGPRVPDAQSARLRRVQKNQAARMARATRRQMGNRR